MGEPDDRGTLRADPRRAVDSATPFRDHHHASGVGPACSDVPRRHLLRGLPSNGPPTWLVFDHHLGTRAQLLEEDVEPEFFQRERLRAGTGVVACLVGGAIGQVSIPAALSISLVKIRATSGKLLPPLSRRQQDPRSCALSVPCPKAPPQQHLHVTTSPSPCAGCPGAHRNGARGAAATTAAGRRPARGLGVAGVGGPSASAFRARFAAPGVRLSPAVPANRRAAAAGQRRRPRRRQAPPRRGCCARRER